MKRQTEQKLGIWKAQTRASNANGLRTLAGIAARGEARALEIPRCQ